MSINTSPSAVIHRFLCRSDNIGVLMSDAHTQTCVAIDAPDDAAILAECQAKGLSVTHLLITHKHHDHIAGLRGLWQTFRPQIIMGEQTAEAIGSSLNGIAFSTVKGGDTVQCGPFEGQVMDTPGHCNDHVSFWFESQTSLFCGDTLFKAGCGRIFEGEPATLFSSLVRLARLPDETQLHCGHDYALSNARFAAAVDPASHTVADLFIHVEEDAAQGRLTSLTTLGEEKKFNPYLRLDDPAVQKAAQAHEPRRSVQSALDIFTVLREWKNTF